MLPPKTSDRPSIGPAMHPYRSRKQNAREALGPRHVCHTRDLEACPCPVTGDPLHEDHVQQLEIVHWIREDEEGRISPAGFADEHGDPLTTRLEICCHQHLPPDSRPPVPARFTRVQSAATCYYCLHPDRIDRLYDPKSSSPPSDSPPQTEVTVPETPELVNPDEPFPEE